MAKTHHPLLVPRVLRLAFMLAVGIVTQAAPGASPRTGGTAAEFAATAGGAQTP